MSQNLGSTVAVIGIDIGKNSFHVVELDRRGVIVLRCNRSLAAKRRDGSFATDVPGARFALCLEWPGSGRSWSAADHQGARRLSVIVE
jgi:hypothetical protein